MNFSRGSLSAILKMPVDQKKYIGMAGFQTRREFCFLRR
jgi:hypothetical protein